MWVGVRLKGVFKCERLQEMAGVTCNYVSDSDYFLFDTLSQVEQTVGHLCKSDTLPPSRQIKLVWKHDNINNGECLPDCRTENGTEEHDVMINATFPKDITKYVHRFLEHVKGEHVEKDITREDSPVTMDMWDFAGRQLYYASHPPFLSSRALYILVQNLSKPSYAPAKHCVRPRNS